MLIKSFTSKTVAVAAVACSIILAGNAANASTITTGTYGTSTTIGCSSDDSQCTTAFAAAGNNSATGSIADSVNWGLFATALGTAKNNGAISNGSQTTTPNGDLITVNSGDANPFTTYVEGQGTAPVSQTVRGQTTTTPGTAWDGMFSNGTTILFTSDGNIKLSFSVPLIGLGIDAQIFNSGTYTETLTAYNTANQIVGIATENSTSGGVTNGVTSAEGTAPFVGISTNATTSNLATNGISYVTISAVCTSTSCTTGGFSIDTSLLYHYPINNQAAPTQTAPEPGTLGLLGVGLIGLGWARRRMRA